MKVLKGNNAITLIALIITIILLLILAIVTISAVNEGNLFAHANNAVTKWNDETAKENVLISNYIANMEKYAKGETSDRLIYYTAYDGTIEETPLKIWFLKGTDKIIVNYNNTDFAKRILNYNWNPNTDELNIMERACTLSEDGRTISYGTDNLNVTDEKFNYISTKIESEQLDLYYGMYYNSTINKMILITKIDDDIVIAIENENTTFTPISYLENTLNNMLITVKNEKIIEYDGNEYTWMASL